MKPEEKPTANGLTPKEIAAITACVPCSGTPYIDAIITQGLRFRTATSAMESLLRAYTADNKANTLFQPGEVLAEHVAQEAIAYADALLAAFRK